MINRNEKYLKANTNAKKTNIKLDVVALQLFCNYIASENKLIHKSNLVNMSKLINNIDMRYYENDNEKLNRIRFIKKGLEARLDYNINKKELILMHINDGLLGYEQDINVEEVDSDEIQWIDRIIADALNYGYINSYIDRLDKLCNKFKNTDTAAKKETVDEFKQTIKEINSTMRAIESNASYDIKFSLKDEVFDDCIRTVYDKVTSPSNKLITGLTGINELLGGGFESKRVYSLFGLPSEGKSITLLDFAYQIKKYNPGYICKDPTKKPCVVYFTLENTIDETVVRLCEMVGIGGTIGDYSVDELIQKLKTEGGLYVNSASPIDFVIRYAPGMSVDTDYLYIISEELEDDGYEPIIFIIDYIKRIKSTLDNSDSRIWLGNVINEFKVFASIKDIPVVTASQLNRDATRHIDESRKTNKNELVRMLGRSQIGESMLILENLDGAFIITPEWDNNGNKFLGFQRIKKRYKASNLEILYYPYQGDIKLVEDFNALSPVYKTTMKDNIPCINFTPIRTTNDIKQLEDVVSLQASKEDNIFRNLTGSISEVFDNTQLKSIVKRLKE